MTRKLARRLFVVLLGLWISLACAPTETGNPSLTTTTSASLVAYSSDVSAVALGGQSGLRVDRLWVAYARIDLYDCHSGAAQTVLAGPIADDIAARPPVRRVLDTDLDAFCRFDIPLELAGSNTTFAGTAMQVEGRRSDDVAFTIRSTVLRHFLLDAGPSGVALGEEAQVLLVAFDVSRWFASVDLDSATVGTDGTIHIDATENPALLTAFESALDHSASLHRDDDRDGVVDPEEVRLDH